MTRILLLGLLLVGCSGSRVAPGGSGPRSGTKGGAPGRATEERPIHALPASDSCAAGSCRRNAVGLAVSGQKACAVTSGGAVACWGDLPLSLLDRGENLAVPQIVPGLDSALEVAVGQNAACARRANGEVTCRSLWSFGSASANDDFEASNRGRPLGSATDAVQVVANAKQGCGRRRSGSVFCWGESASFPDSASEVARPTGIEDAVDVALGADHACVAHASGKVSCWGSNVRGQSGGSLSTPSREPTEVGGVTNVVDVAAGDRHTCALKRSGRVTCWGASEHGELGHDPGATWETTREIEHLDHVSALALGTDFSCAVRLGRVLCWGDNASGQLGRTPGAPDSEPREVSGLDDVVELAAGSGFACARHRSGNVSCWGISSANQAGQGIARPIYVPPGSVVGFEPPARDAWLDQPSGQKAPLAASCPRGLRKGPRSCEAAFTTCGCRYLCRPRGTYAECEQACEAPTEPVPRCGFVEGRCAELLQVSGDRCDTAPPLPLGTSVVAASSAHDDYGGSCAGAGAPDVVYALDLGRPSLLQLAGAGSFYVRSTCEATESEESCATGGERGPISSTLLRPGRHFVFVDGVCGAGAPGIGAADPRISAVLFDVGAVVDRLLSAPLLASGRAVTGDPRGRQGLLHSPCQGAFDEGEVVYRLELNQRTRVRFTLRSAAPARLHVRRDWAGFPRDAFCAPSERAESEHVFEAGRYFVVVNATDGFELSADFPL